MADPRSVEKYRTDVAAYASERPLYQTLARVLERVLQRAVDNLGLEAIVQVRTKQLASFAEKTIRKQALYPDPPEHDDGPLRGKGHHRIHQRDSVRIGNPSVPRLERRERYHRKSVRARLFAGPQGGATGKAPRSRRARGLGRAWISALP